MELNSIKDQMPNFDEEVLLYWVNLDHFENGTLTKVETPHGIRFGHILFDGESLSCNPTHWAPMPTEWKSFDEESPKDNQNVILMWEGMEHCENGYIFQISTGRAHTLFDGERLSKEPTHWAAI